MKDPILITGAARSGTSMVAGIIDTCGGFGGEMSGPNRNNAKGMFENYRVRNQIVKPYLKRSGYDPMGQFPLPDINTMPIPANWRRLVNEIFQSQGADDKTHWYYKGAKMCLMWPVWNYAYPKAKWIIVRRKTEDIVNSCLKTGFMSAFSRSINQVKVGAKSEDEAWTWWVEQHETRFREMIEKGLNVKVVWPERMVTGDYEEMYETIEWLGLKWTSEVYQFIDPKLWKARKKLK